MDNEVQLLHRALVDAIARCRPDVESQPVTVGEILNELLPYRSARSLVGFEMNADYEHALMRLLAGVDGLVRLEPEDAREHLARELAAPNPDVRIVREYSAFNAWVTAPASAPDEAVVPAPEPPDWETPGWLSELSEAPSPAAAGADPWNMPVIGAEPPAAVEPAPTPIEALMANVAEAVPAAAPAPAPARARSAAAAGGTGRATRAAAAPRTPAPSQAALPLVDAPAAATDSTPVAPVLAAATPAPNATAKSRPAPAEAGAEAEAPAPPANEQCAFCHGALPKGKAIRYCPFCGADQQLRPCPRCGETLEPAWRYCISCGAPAPSGAPA